MKIRKRDAPFLVSPEILFLVGTLQALFPYAIWSLSGFNENYSYDLGYIPALIYVTGYIAFFLGSSLIRRKPHRACRDGTMNSIILRRATIVIFCIAIVEFFLAMETYGGLPLLNYFEGSSDVSEMNARQAEAAFGQLGLLTLTTFLMTGAILVLLTKPGPPRFFSRFLFVAYLVLVWLITSMAGKRQGFLLCAFSLVAGIGVRQGNPIQTILQFVGVSGPIARSRVVKSFTVLFGVLFVLIYVATLGVLRTGTGKLAFGISDVTQYMEVPLINFEYQCNLVGLGPYTFSFTDLFKGFLPYR